MNNSIPTQENQFPVYDVIISGAGPVGLFLACELGLAGISVLVLEKSADAKSPLKRLPFGIRGLSAPSIEALDRRGLLTELEIHKRIKNPHAATKPAEGLASKRQVGHFAGIPFFESNIDTSQWKHRLPSSTPTSLISEMEELETVLTRRAENLGVTIKRGMEVTGLRQTAHPSSTQSSLQLQNLKNTDALVSNVTVECGEHAFQAQWLVGCDGSRSAVRKLSGFEFAGTEPAFTGYTTMLELADPEKLKPGRNITNTGMYMQSQPGYVLIQDFDGGEFHHSRQPITCEHVESVLRRVSQTDVTVTTLHTATTWTDRAKQATKYRNGHVLLAGDAAHIHSPLGGQGLNLGLGDAMNLGWKLAATLKGNAPEGLLDTYFSERHPIGAQVLDWSRAQVEIMKPTPQSRALHAVMKDLLDTKDATTYVAARVWGIIMYYDLGGTHPLVGYSVPNFEWVDGGTVGERLRGEGGAANNTAPHCQSKGLLLDFTASASLKALANSYNQQLRYLSCTPKNSLGMRALLVRPDGIIAWATDKDPKEIDFSEAVKAAERWFTKDRHVASSL